MASKMIFSKTHVITDFINSAISKNYFNAYNWDRKRQFLHADDCSNALLKIHQNYEILKKGIWILQVLNGLPYMKSPNNIKFLL